LDSKGTYIAKEMVSVLKKFGFETPQLSEELFLKKIILSPWEFLQFE
jgi:hypothetical protein